MLPSANLGRRSVEIVMIELSSTAKSRMGMRRLVHAKTGGRCFYCGIHVRCAVEPLPRDWLPVRGTLTMVPEHAVPISRDGTDDLENLVPSCGGCNAAKGALTLDEFRLLRGLRGGNPSSSFPGEEPSRSRDWLCCYSHGFEREIFLVNKPYAADAYSRGRSLRKRSKTAARLQESDGGRHDHSPPSYRQLHDDRQRPVRG